MRSGSRLRAGRQGRTPGQLSQHDLGEAVPGDESTIWSVLQGTGAPNGKVKDGEQCVYTWPGGCLVWAARPLWRDWQSNCEENSLPERLEVLLFSAYPHCLGCKVEVEQMEKGVGWDEGAELPSAA